MVVGAGVVVVGSAVVVVVSGAVVVVVSGAVVVVGARVVVVASSVRIKAKLFAEVTKVLITITMAPAISQYYLSPRKAETSPWAPVHFRCLCTNRGRNGC